MNPNLFLLLELGLSDVLLLPVELGDELLLVGDLLAQLTDLIVLHLLVVLSLRQLRLRVGEVPPQ